MQLLLILHNIRSTYNVGAILRTADGLGVNKVYFSGYTPYPAQKSDTRLPHIRAKTTSQIHKTALGAEVSVKNEQAGNIDELIAKLKGGGYKMVALEQSGESVLLDKFNPPDKLALLLGEEVNGIEPRLLKLCDQVVEIAMHGKKESFNVSVAAGIAMYHITQAASG